MFGANRKLDYGKLLAEVDEPVKAVAYGVEFENQASNFKLALERKGFDIKFKAPKIFKHEDYEDRKADWDVGMTIDIVKEIDNFDVVILGTADSDLAPCVEYIRSKGKECYIIGCCISHELKEVANGWFEITERMLE